MPHVVTQSCCNDATCVSVCPVNCIHPSPDEPAYATAEMLYIDPATCIDCGACVDVCPVDAIKADYELTGDFERYTEINAQYFTDPAHRDYTPRPVDRAPAPAVDGPLRVAIVGSGPSACYAAEELLAHKGVEVTMVERLLTPWGLVRFGVAPDHQHTKQVTRLFTRTAARERFTLHLGVEVGKHVTHEELLAHHHAVIYAVGAAGDRKLGVPGEDLPGVHSATEFVAWYNGHPDFRDARFDLSGKRAVVVGNGNVALDVARILVTDDLTHTDIADHALEALAHSGIEEVVVLGRRGSDQAAYTTPEVLALGSVVDVAGATGSGLKSEIVRELAARPHEGNRRIVLRFLTSPVEILGDGRVTGVLLGRNELTESGGARDTGEREVLDCDLVLTSIGYRANPLPGLPFDEKSATLPNELGRVVENDGAPVPGVYATGWIKRGPSGVIGTNRQCAQETVAALLRDFETGSLPTPSVEDFDGLVRSRQPEAIGFAGWKAIDRRERELGQGRPRRKLVDPAEQLAAAGDAR
ncbi:4Fe-4S dicluster domain-containing protein [Amycolatopsis acidicola]|uniref:ferredoxin--NADP(+) reductase n=1 Tax=Amycolatopsis acidicola TaxID=2596893 RepID=A0A5N0UUW8_9PSEU|nr:FAD-dependent oxidoreductase [Amycolatopsis acidicola]KAA9153997.1 4Fe-4S dicluster domain-containing protein [Amycolatopsis acidicola]